MFDDEVSAINIIDGLIDDARVLLVFLNVILIFALCISSSLINTRLFNIFAWITVIIASIDLLLTIIDVISGFWGENLVGSIVALVINTAITAVSVWALIKTLNYINIQLSLIYKISIGATIFCVLSLVVSTITQFNLEAFIENIRLILIFSILIVGMYNILQLNFNGTVSSVFAEIGNYLIYIICGIIVFDIILCIIDLVKGIADSFDIGDLIMLLLNLIIFATLAVGTFFADKLVTFLGDRIALNNVLINYSFSTKLFVGFILYVLIDLAISVPLNLISNIADVISGEC